MKIPRQLIENFLTSEFSVVKTNNSSEWRINSPFSSDKKYKLYISLDKQSFIDFKAEGSPDGQGSFLKFVRMYLDLKNDQEAFLYLIKNYGTREQQEEVQQATEKPRSDVINEFLKNDNPKWFKDKPISEFGQKFYNYAANRKIEESYLETLGYVFDPGSRYANRLIVPFFESGNLVYFTARDLAKESRIRYLNPIGLDTKEFVFNLDNINEEVIIVEGPLDACSFTVEQTATCMSGAFLGEKQIKKIFSKKPNTIIYVPDQDETGLKRMHSNLDELIMNCPYSSRLDVYVYSIPKPFKDFNELKVSTGKNYILKKECEKYTKTKWRDFDLTKRNKIAV